MSRLSFFGAPLKSFQSGGAHIAVYVVPVFDGRLTVFDVDAPGVRGRFLPWTVLAFGGNPYVDASLLVDDWCEGAVSSLRLVDVIGGHQAEGSEELAIVFRAELTAAPVGDRNRKPVLVAPNSLARVGPFPATELDRWIADGADVDIPAAPEPPPADKSADDGPQLLF